MNEQFLSIPVCLPEQQNFELTRSTSIDLCSFGSEVGEKLMCLNSFKELCLSIHKTESCITNRHGDPFFPLHLSLLYICSQFVMFVCGAGACDSTS